MDTTTKKVWPAQNEMQIGWTATYPRPTEDNGHHPALLADRQAEWDEAETLRVKYAKRVDEIRARRELEEQERRDAAAAEAQAREQKGRAELEATLRRRFIAAGGASDEWDAQKDSIVAEHVKQQTLAGSEDRAR